MPYQIRSICYQISMFTSYRINNRDSRHFETFCCSELLLYKHFCNIEKDIGLTADAIVANWYQLNSNGYTVWHVVHNIEAISAIDDQEDSENEITSSDNIEMQE